MRRWLVLTWVAVAAPFVLTGATGGPDGLLPHAIFHPVYIAIILVALFLLVRLRSLTHSPVVRGLTLALIIFQVAAMVGHIGEEISVIRHGGLEATEALFEEPFHVASAWITVPSLLLSQLLLIALTIAAVVAGRASRRHPAVASAL
jgi:hypothetical protein